MKKLFKLSLAFSLIASFAFLAQSCKSVKSIATTTVGGTWVLKSLNGIPVQDIFKGKNPTMNLDFNTMRVYGNAGCNTYTGTFTYTGGVFSASRIASTMMACAFENKEDDFTNMLSKENTLSMDKGLLVLKNNGTVVATFEKGIDMSSVGAGEWTLQSMGKENMATLFPNGKYPTLTMTENDKRIGGNAGCNRYNATYEVSGTTLEVGPIMSTKMACENLSGENKFTNTLMGKSKITLLGNTLVLSKEGKEILKFTKK